MMRLHAVRSLLVEEVGGIPGTPSRRWRRGRGSDDAEPADAGPADPERSPEERDALLREILDQAARKALGMAVLCWTAIGVLFLTHESPDRFFSFRGIETVFTVGILVVATYGGYRLGQWEKYRAVSRAVEELEARDEG